MLPDALVADVLAKLGVPRPTRDQGGLRALYRAWCRSVPFDNVRKMIHVRAEDPAPLPGDDPQDFFAAWLRDGTGGTCWAGNGALCALLETLGFDARRGVATMLVVPDLPPNHGTVSVALDGRRYLTDASILHGEPLPLDPTDETAIDHPAWGVRCRREEGRLHVRWRPLHLPGGFDCRIERLDASADEFRSFHEGTRTWSPFNYQLSVRVLRDDRVLGVGMGQRGEIDGEGQARTRELPADERGSWLRELGFSDAVVAALPDDQATPPPPGSATAARG